MASEATVEGDRQVQSMPHQRLDRDPSRLTTFPMPGYMSTTFFPRSPISEGGARIAGSPIKERPPPMSTGSNQYWMPDHLCKVCFECGSSFSFFRRRHHCRLCGQIFCYDCSNHFIDGSPHGFSGQVRVCTFCARYVEEANKQKGTDASQRTPGNGAYGSATSASNTDSGGTTVHSAGREGVDRRTNLINPEAVGIHPSPLVFGPDPSVAELLAPGDDSEVNAPPSPTDSSEDSDIAAPQLDAPPQHRRASSESSVATLNGTVDKMRARLHHRPTWRRSSVELLGAIKSGGLLDAEIQAIMMRKKEKKTPDGIELSSGSEPSSSNSKDALHTRREISLDRYMHAAHERIRDGIKHAVEDMSGSLLASDPMDLSRLSQSLEDVAFVVAGHLLFSMNFRSPSGFNYSSLVKVKSIAAADTVQKNVKEKNYHFKWLAGTVFRKHVSHKQMARQITNPRILLFACGISYDRSSGTGRLSSLDTLLEQEKSYMSILVEKISALEPDVIFVEKTVSRYAQESLRERNVAIVLNVKHELLERIARHTGAALLTSVDHVDKADRAEVVGTCRTFQVKTIPTVPDEDPLPESARPSAPRKLFGMVKTAPPKESTRTRTETFLYLDGCDPLNGCTVLITGLSKQKLRLLKRLTRGVLSMTYRLLLEAHVLSDLNLNQRMLTSRESVELLGNKNTTWCTTCTLRVRDASGGGLSQRYHQCVESKHLGIMTYSDNDISFGNFLTQEMAALSLKCQNVKCHEIMAAHIHSFSCRSGTVIISFEELPDKSKRLTNSAIQTSEQSATEKSMSERSGTTIGSLDNEINVLSMLASNPLSQSSISEVESSSGIGNIDAEHPAIIFWRWCRECHGVVTPFIPMEKYIYKYSFARFLEVLFSDDGAYQPPPSEHESDGAAVECDHSSLESHVLFFNIGNRVARFDFTRSIPLRLARVNNVFKGSVSPASENDEDADAGKFAAIHDAVQKRLAELKTLLGSITEIFFEKIRGIGLAVDALQLVDKEHYGRVVLEVMCLSNLVKAGEATYQYKLEQLRPDEQPAQSLASCDAIQRSLYLLACKWIACMLQLRKLIKAYITKGKSGRSTPTKPKPLSAGGSFTLGGVTFNVPAVESEPSSPRVYEEPTLTPSGISKSFDFGEPKERRKRVGSSEGANSINDDERSPKSIISSASASVDGDGDYSKASTSPFVSTGEKLLAAKSAIDLKEAQQSSWKSALWDLYRALGRSTTGSDFTVTLPDALAAGHPSLPHRWKDRVILVNHMVPITLVAYSLASDAYEEQLDAWKLIVHRENAATVSMNAKGSRHDRSDILPVSTNWSRAALTSSLSTPFKYSATDVPLHLSLLSEKSSLNLWNASWELSMIAYYPVQFEVLRELFYGSLPNFLGSIAHVADWQAKGGKSGASFFRTLDDRFVVKHISSTEMQSFLEVLPGYFKYMAKIYFDGEESILSKTVGLYQTTIIRKDSGQRIVQNICVMENAFFRKQLTQTYDLKGSSRNRFAKLVSRNSSGSVGASSPSSGTVNSSTNAVTTPTHQQVGGGTAVANPTGHVLLDGDFVESTKGHPLGLFAEDHEFMVNAVKNDTAFLYSSNIVDYSMVVGMGPTSPSSSEMTVGIIDYMRQFDFIKRVESVGKSVGMIAGQSSPTIIEPGMYGKRFLEAIRRYFMPITPISSGTNEDR